MGKKKGNKTNDNPSTSSKSSQAQPAESRQGQEQPAQPLQSQREREQRKGKPPTDQSERQQDQPEQHQQLRSQGKPGQGKPKQDGATPSQSSQFDQPTHSAWTQSKQSPFESGQFTKDQKQQLPLQGHSQPAQPRQGQPERQQQKGKGQSGQSEQRQDQSEHHQQQQWQGQPRQEKSKQAIPSESSQRDQPTHSAWTQVRPRPSESGLSIKDQKSQPDRQRSQVQTQPAQSRQGQPQRQSSQSERRQDQPGQHQQPKRLGQPWQGKPGLSESRQDQSGRKDQKHSGQRHPIQDVSAKFSTIDLSRSPSVSSTASSRSEAKSLSDASHAASPIIQSSALVPVAQYKGCGTNGRKIRVDVNFLPLVIEKLLPTVYQYDVTIEPNLPKRLLPKIFEQFRRNNFQNISIAFDGQKIAVAPKMIPITDRVQKQTKVLDENGKERVYMVAIKEARDSEIDFSSLKNYTRMRQYDAPLRALQMLEIVLKSPFLNKNGVQAGRSFYMLPNRRVDLGDNFELWTGLYQSTVLGSRPYLNVDIAHKAFPSELSLMDILRNNRANLDNWDQRDEFALLSHLKGLMITYAMPGQEASRRTYKFLRLNNNSKNFKFKNDQDGREYTIFEYFQSRGVNLRYPYLPTLTVGNSVKNITVPMECCAVAGYQALKKKCTELQTRNMIKIAATSTDVRRQKIMDMLQQIQHNQSPVLSEFGVAIDNQFANIPARVLRAPLLQYCNNAEVMPEKGQWRIDNKQFLIAKPLTRYAVLSMDRRVDEYVARDFCDLMNRIGKSLGMNIDPNYDMLSLNSMDRNFENNMQTLMARLIGNKIELLFCIIPDRGDCYAKVKQCAELRCGILTQCIKAITMLKKGTDASTVSNILLKVNAKLNGTNHKFADVSRLPLMRNPFMLIGADVTHPSPGQENIPSVVGVVSSHDFYGYKYNKCWRLQDPKQEMISNFDDIIKEHLKFFEEKNDRLPGTILYFRDGVSEGQFQQVLTIELNAIYRGCQQYKNDYKPKITFIVVQKRHHTRFFPPHRSNLGFDDRRNNNVPPGTIVDTEITHPNESQFYLVSHQSIQGVAKPTKYCLLRDDSDFSIDDLQALTYNLCHFFTRCTRSVSYPAPTYYAHLAASRGRVYIEGRNINMDKLDMEFNNRTVKEVISKGHPMYFV